MLKCLFSQYQVAMFCTLLSFCFCIRLSIWSTLPKQMSSCMLSMKGKLPLSNLKQIYSGFYITDVSNESEPTKYLSPFNGCTMFGVYSIFTTGERRVRALGRYLFSSSEYSLERYAIRESAILFFTWSKMLSGTGQIQSLYKV